MDSWVVLLVICMASIATVNAVIPLRDLHYKKIQPENEVLKAEPEDSYEDSLPEEPIPEGPIPTVAPEAFYYGIYGDLLNNEVEGPGREGNATTTSSCGFIREVPEYLRDERFMRPRGISYTYQKYTEAYGIPVLGSSDISDRALTRACYVLRYLLADRDDLRNEYYRNWGRVTILPEGQNLRDIPEYYFLPEVYDQASSRGLGAIRIAPASSAGQENIQCLGHDQNRREDVLVRTLAQGISQLAAKYLIPNFRSRLESLYERAMLSGWWENTYAAHTPDSYFGQAVQAYFNVNGFASPPNGVYNGINTRTKLRSYDPEIYYFIHQLFPCGNTYLKRCNNRGNEIYQNLGMNCAGLGYFPPQ